MDLGNFEIINKIEQSTDREHNNFAAGHCGGGGSDRFDVPI